MKNPQLFSQVFFLKLTWIILNQRISWHVIGLPWHFLWGKGLKPLAAATCQELPGIQEEKPSRYRNGPKENSPETLDGWVYNICPYTHIYIIYSRQNDNLIGWWFLTLRMELVQSLMAASQNVPRISSGYRAFEMQAGDSSGKRRPDHATIIRIRYGLKAGSPWLVAPTGSPLQMEKNNRQANTYILYACKFRIV